MADNPHIVCIVGPESSGKTTLALQLAQHFNVPMVPEYAREFLLRSGGNYSEADLLQVAKGQLDLEARIAERCENMMICDTDILVIKIWQEFKFGRPNEELDELLETQLGRKYLLTYPDLPWVEDSLRENPNDLMDIFAAYQEALESQPSHYEVIRGEGHTRLKNALRLLSGGPIA